MHAGGASSKAGLIGFRRSNAIPGGLPRGGCRPQRLPLRVQGGTALEDTLKRGRLRVPPINVVKPRVARQRCILLLLQKPIAAVAVPSAGAEIIAESYDSAIIFPGPHPGQRAAGTPVARRRKPASAAVAVPSAGTEIIAESYDSAIIFPGPLAGQRAAGTPVARRRARAEAPGRNRAACWHGDNCRVI